MTKIISLPRYLLMVCTLLLSNNALSAGHQHSKPVEQNTACVSADIACAKTVTSAFSPKGDLWRLWVHQQKMYVQISVDKGMRFSPAKVLPIPAEQISARNENRPKIAFDNNNGVYLSWAKPLEKKYTADIRFSYSKDYGQTFSAPITVNNDNLLTGHSFNEMVVTENGEVSIVWLDSRYAYAQRKQGKKVNGSELYLAKGVIKSGQKNHADNSLSNVEFTNEALATGTCVCCRIATDVNQSGELAIFWRHIYGDNIREFALLTLHNETPSQPIQISYDHWKINGCPHQGGALSIDQQNLYHMVWFNQGDKGKGIFYVNSQDQGQTLTKPLSVGKQSAQAAHPHLLENNKTVDIVWTEFTGTEHQLWHQRSLDRGAHFTKAKILATATNGSDRPFIIKQGNINYVSWQRPTQGHWLQKL